MAYDDPVDVATISDLVHQVSAPKVAVVFRNYELFGDEAIARPGILVADYVRLTRQMWPASGVAFYHYPHMSDDQVLALQSTVFADSQLPRANTIP
jgi:hypothetical protein